jgi:hypothetical protein
MMVSQRLCRPPPQPSPVATGEGEPRSGWEGAGTSEQGLACLWRIA